MRTRRKLALGVIGALVAASPLLAHHEWPVDRTKEVTVTGTVTAYTWADPHVMIALDVQANGTIEKWKVGGSNKKYSAVNGWDRNTLKPGDVITGIGYRFKDGSNAAQLQKIVMASGKEMYLYMNLFGPPALRTPPSVLPAADPTSIGTERRP
jgi:hypothetical protein